MGRFWQRKRCQVRRSWETSVTRRRNNAPDTSLEPARLRALENGGFYHPPLHGRTLGRDQPSERWTWFRSGKLPPLHEPPKQTPLARTALPAIPDGGGAPAGAPRKPGGSRGRRCGLQADRPACLGPRPAAGLRRWKARKPAEPAILHQGERPTRERPPRGQRGLCRPPFVTPGRSRGRLGKPARGAMDVRTPASPRSDGRLSQTAEPRRIVWPDDNIPPRRRFRMHRA